MNKYVEKDIELWSRYIQCAKDLEPLCDKFEEAEELLLKENLLAADSSISFGEVSIIPSLYINHTNRIPECLKILCKKLGKITSRNIVHETKIFRFNFKSKMAHLY